MIEVFLIALALSADAFAVSIGLSTQIRTIKTALFLVAYFAVFHAVMPAIGFFLGLGVVNWINQFAHWLGFLLLLGVGCKMIYDSVIESRNKKTTTEHVKLPPNSLGHLEIFTLAIVTSIDALAVGTTLATLSITAVPPLFSFLLIGGITGIVTLLGLLIGRKSQDLFSDKAGIFGGSILILIGIRLLLD